mmetsp:Transcript_60304/g.127699  ORF Transcript_60304/g.127699 Transcript_60304/m.127699 type:complete len:373 (-) Transcript_60304:257-1375(-)|eukprot:CAMPEP_0206459258 /NCGR_PEP_ID=MMETSP0324_2-20121206/24072_1 /ASSEMBLY_ACC=CAM_ASM_000836 /TAXON_ID=2866 /ORGANISM="Crypthecodinium cohnii, Strain Seligo" /LENGTH=372 /DNA_ID=CAMNT_0053930781 /DNA_START=17 /DNA_END=1135 /DNA_ORIENTATION=+
MTLVSSSTAGHDDVYRGHLTSALLLCGTLLTLCLEGCSNTDSSDVAGNLAGTVSFQTSSLFLESSQDVMNETSTSNDNVEGQEPARRVSSFLVIGDWGWDPDVHTQQLLSRSCQETIADTMHAKFEELGDVDFVINVGDSFYPNGVSSQADPQWDTKWRGVYSKKLRSVPWFSVYGNHDYFVDKCACSDDTINDCAQVNSDIKNLDFFFMPNTSYYYTHPELDLEIIALEMNFEWASRSCLRTLCPNECSKFLKSKQLAAFELFYERMKVSKASNIIVFTHYPTDYFGAYPDFLGNLTTSPGRQITVFGGHRHNVDTRSVTSIAPNVAWVVGGGGGWGCDGNEQGFVVGEIGPKGDVHTSPVIVSPSKCCGR